MTHPELSDLRSDTGADGRLDLQSINDTLRLAGPHRTRAIRFVRNERIGDWRLKLYTIAVDERSESTGRGGPAGSAGGAGGEAPRGINGDTARPALVEEALRRAPAIYPTSAYGEQRHGIGFIIVHDARTASIALYYWWQSFNELHQRILAGPKHEPRAMTQLEHASAGCVWEIEVIDFERRAWLADVLANPGGPDVERYLGRRLDTDV